VLPFPVAGGGCPEVTDAHLIVTPRKCPDAAHPGGCRWDIGYLGRFTVAARRGEAGAKRGGSLVRGGK
jgi:hypothetical protein